MKSSTVRMLVFVAVLTAALSAVPEFALGRGPVPNDCYAYGHQLQGMAETEALAAIAASATVPASGLMTVTVDGRIFHFRPSNAMVVNTAAMLNQAYEDTTAAGFDVKPVYKLYAPPITTWAQAVAKRVYVKPLNARYYYSDGRLRVYKGRIGRRLNYYPFILSMRSAVTTVAASGEITSTPVRSRRLTTTPSITVSELPAIIVTDLSDRRIRLYHRGVFWHSYRCAVGMSAYPTPRGKWTIVRKVKWPSWTNPGSDWAAGMPSYIAPGPYNPLGTRALYLNAPGIRIHGTSKRSSIGTAASHGCLRMLREDIEALYKLVPVGTSVWIVK